MKAKFDITVWFENVFPGMDAKERETRIWVECEDIKFEDVELDVDQRFPLMNWEERDEYMQGLLAELIRFAWDSHTRDGDDVVLKDFELWFEEDLKKVSPVALVEKVIVHNWDWIDDDDENLLELRDTVFEDVRFDWTCKTHWKLIEQ